jgi:hypothetical protein
VADGKTVFAYIGIGCVVIIGLMSIAAGACGVWVYSEAQRFEQEFRDPVARGDRVMEVLGTDTLPDGYYPMLAFSIPFVMETAMLTDEERVGEDVEPNFGDRGFIYLKMLRLGQDEEELRDYFEGRTDDADVLSGNGININVEEVIGRGAMEHQGADLMYVVQRGQVSMGGRGRDRGDGLASMALIECPDDSRLRIGIWFVPDPDPEAEPEMLDLTGTPGDPDAMSAFYGHFNLCG